MLTPAWMDGIQSDFFCSIFDPFTEVLEQAVENGFASIAVC
jgi:hypothetical protein